MAGGFEPCKQLQAKAESDATPTLKGTCQHMTAFVNCDGNDQRKDEDDGPRQRVE